MNNGILSWIEFILHRKNSGMHVNDMFEYTQLFRKSTKTTRRRGSILETHRENLRAKVRELNDCIGLLDAKIAN